MYKKVIDMDLIHFIKRHDDFLVSLVLAASLPLLSFTDIVYVSGVSSGSHWPIIIFISLAAASAAVLKIFQDYEAVIARAKQAELIPRIRNTLFMPLLTAIFGLIFSVITSIIKLNFSVYKVIGISASILRSTIIVFLISYSSISYYKSVLFVYKIVEGESTETGDADE